MDSLRSITALERGNFRHMMPHAKNMKLKSKGKITCNLIPNEVLTGRSAKFRRAIIAREVRPFCTSMGSMSFFDEIEGNGR